MTIEFISESTRHLIPKILQGKWDRLILETLHSRLDEAYQAANRWDNNDFGVTEIRITPQELVTLVESAIISLNRGQLSLFTKSEATALVAKWIATERAKYSLAFKASQS